MATITPTIISESTEGERKRVIFQFVSDTGETFGPYVEDRPAAESAAEFAARQATAVTNSLVESELSKFIALADDEAGDPVYRWANKTVLGERLLEIFLNLKGIRLCRFARFISRNYTDNQIKAGLGLTQPQFDALKTKIVAMIQRINAIEADTL